MKSHTEYLWFNTKRRHEYIRITDRVQAACSKCGIEEGMVLVSAMHITAGVFVNDNESGILTDIAHLLEGLAPTGPDYLHHRTGEKNGDAHLKSILVHHQVIVPVTKGRLDLGPWQEIFYAEFDGQREKRVIIKVLGE
ncbi:MAG TPA: secondary thiamine-phosphate synthase enzyme [Syntrophomonas sp.]|nr:secondary thiamine-phosphate synthase enzyme [Syntrophomonas sp.]